jgi:hypothetical protein
VRGNEIIAVSQVIARIVDDAGQVIFCLVIARTGYGPSACDFADPSAKATGGPLPSAAAQPPV